MKSDDEKDEEGAAAAPTATDEQPKKLKKKLKNKDKAEKGESTEGGEDAPSAENYVVTSKIKGFIKAAGYNCGGDLATGVSKKVTFLLKQAVKRAESNGRKTVRRQDL